MENKAITLFWNRARHSAMFFGALGTAVRMGSNLLLLPLVVTRLSEPELALWWVFLALGAFANLAEFGFGPAISRAFSYLWAGAEDFEAEGLRPPPKDGQPNLERIRVLAATVRFLYWRLSAGATLLLAVGGTLFLLRPAADAPAAAHLWSWWAVFVLAIGFNLGASYWMIACQGVNRMRDLQAAFLWSGLAYALSAAALLLAGAGLAAMVVATFVRGLVLRYFCRRAYEAVVPPAAGPAPAPQRELLKRLWPNAWKFGTLSLGGFLIANGNVLISSAFLSERVTASFGLTAQLGVFITGFSALWLTVKWSDLAILRQQGRLEEMSTLFARRLAFTLVSFGILAGGLFLLGDRALEFLGTSKRLLPRAELAVYLGYLGVQLFYVQFGSLAYTENVVPFFKVGLYTGLAMFGLSLALTPTLELWGMLLAPLIAELACSAWYTVRRGFAGQPLRPGQFLRAAMTGKA